MKTISELWLEYSAGPHFQPSGWNEDNESTIYRAPSKAVEQSWQNALSSPYANVYDDDQTPTISPAQFLQSQPGYLSLELGFYGPFNPNDPNALRYGIKTREEGLIYQYGPGEFGYDPNFGNYFKPATGTSTPIRDMQVVDTTPHAYYGLIAVATLATWGVASAWAGGAAVAGETAGAIAAGEAAGTVAAEYAVGELAAEFVAEELAAEFVAEELAAEFVAEEFVAEELAAEYAAEELAAEYAAEELAAEPLFEPAYDPFPQPSSFPTVNWSSLASQALKAGLTYAARPGAQARPPIRATAPGAPGSGWYAMPDTSQAGAGLPNGAIALTLLAATGLIGLALFTRRKRHESRAR
jgi:hypothetical protein